MESKSSQSGLEIQWSLFSWNLPEFSMLSMVFGGIFLIHLKLRNKGKFICPLLILSLLGRRNPFKVLEWRNLLFHKPQHPKLISLLDFSAGYFFFSPNYVFWLLTCWENHARVHLWKTLLLFLPILCVALMTCLRLCPLLLRHQETGDSHSHHALSPHPFLHCSSICRILLGAGILRTPLCTK